MTFQQHLFGDNNDDDEDSSDSTMQNKIKDEHEDEDSSNGTMQQGNKREASYTPRLRDGISRESDGGVQDELGEGKEIKEEGNEPATTKGSVDLCLKFKRNERRIKREAGKCVQQAKTTGTPIVIMQGTNGCES